MKHTPEPWEVYNEHYITASDEKIACQFFDRMDYYYSNKDANAARIVECVNALAGIENPAEWVKRMKKIEVILAFDDLKMAQNEAAKIGFGNYGKSNDYETQIATLTKERDGFDSKLEQAYRCGERKATYYKEDGTVILPKNYQGVDG